MRISFFLNSRMSKSCTQSRTADWFQQDRKPHQHFPHENTKPFAYYGASSSKQSRVLQSRSVQTETRSGQWPALVGACYELQWFMTRTSLAHALDSALKQISSLSSLLLFYFTLALLSAQVAGLALLLSCAVAVPPPLGFQFMVAAVCVISVTAFKIMY